MRDRVMMRLGGGEYPLLPAFGVHEQFEDRFGSLQKHLVDLVEFVAPLKQRSFLVFLAMKAAREEDGGSSDAMTWEATHKSMWEAGPAVGAIPAAEVELIERLLYTPEQYQRKKDQEAAMTKAEQDLEIALGGLRPSSE